MVLLLKSVGDKLIVTSCWLIYANVAEPSRALLQRSRLMNRVLTAIQGWENELSIQVFPDHGQYCIGNVTEPKTVHYLAPGLM